MVWSTNLETFHGRQENTFEGTLSIAPEDFAPQDATGVLAAIGKALQTHEPCRLEYRLLGRSEREERWFEASVTVIVQDGVAVQLLGLCRDPPQPPPAHPHLPLPPHHPPTLAP